MGAYVNPSDTTKELWLEKHGREIRAEEAEVTDTELPVCLVDNMIFTAAGIGYCDREIRAFAKPDGRPKTWFMAPREKLHEVSPELSNYLELVKPDES